MAFVEGETGHSTPLLMIERNHKGRKMKWLLVVFVLNAPVKTDLVFNNLADCLSAESQMRKEWAELYSQAQKSGAAKETLGLMSSQMTKGTCIPSK